MFTQLKKASRHFLKINTIKALLKSQELMLMLSFSNIYKIIEYLAAKLAN